MIFIRKTKYSKDREIEDLKAMLVSERKEIIRLMEALEYISDMPLSELNPDGQEQAAFSMQTAARDALGEK